MNDTELHARLEAQGFIRTFNGGNTHIYVKGDIVVSGADGDLPSEHWYCAARPAIRLALTVPREGRASPAFIGAAIAPRSGD